MGFTGWSQEAIRFYAGLEQDNTDESPYKTAIGATLDSGGYIQLSSKPLSDWLDEHVGR